jgi:hypothetical protein
MSATLQPGSPRGTYPSHFVIAIEVLIVMECCVIGQAIVTRFEKKADVTS